MATLVGRVIREVLEGGGGGSGTQKIEYQKWPNEISNDNFKFFPLDHCCLALAATCSLAQSVFGLVSCRLPANPGVSAFG